MNRGYFIVKLKQLMMILCCTGVLVACSEKEATHKETVQTETQEQVEEEKADNSGIEVDKGLLHIELTFPKEYFEEDELDALRDEMHEEQNADVKQNEDGSLTVKMSKKDHKSMLHEMKESLEESMKEIVEDEEFSSINDISFNNDFSKFKIIVDEAGYQQSWDGFATLTVGFAGMYYQAFAGKDVEKEKVIIELVNAETNDVFDEIIYPDVLDDIEEIEDDM